MGLVQRDYLKRQFDRLAKLVAGLMKLHGKATEPERNQLLSEAAGELLGLDLAVIDVMDVGTAVRILGGAERVAVYAGLLEARGRSGSGPASRKDLERAASLYAESLMMKRLPEPERALRELLEREGIVLPAHYAEATGEAGR